jgi:ectoine hydroxylase-related dioxygenase (phytanoyl-CoA dioxygenase family)
MCGLLRRLTAFCPEELGPLTFAAGSHRSEYGRELAIGDESETRLNPYVTEAGYRVDDSPYAIGDVSFHAGWTIHRAPANSSATPRRVMTVIYMDAAIEVTRPTNPYQESDLANFLGGRPVGSVADGPLNPVLWSA